MPRIGLISDSHGRADITRIAMAELVRHDVELVLHLGDIGTCEVIDALAVYKTDQSSQLEVRIVFGNTDWDITAMSQYAKNLGIHVDHPVGRLQWNCTSLVFCHGHQQKIIREAVQNNIRYLCHGHTHQACDLTESHTRIINPGALSRATCYSIAILDTAQDNLIFITLNSH